MAVSKKKLSTRFVPGIGPTPCDLMLLGEAPGVEEDKLLQPFVGQVGRFLDRHLFKPSGVERSSCRIVNSVPYRSVDNKTPNIVLIREFRNYVREEIEKAKPKVVLLLGNVALHSVLPIYKDKQENDSKKSSGVTGIATWRGKLIWHSRLNCYVLPAFHPAVLLRDWQQGLQYRTDLTIADFEEAAKYANRERPTFIYPTSVTVKTKEQARKLLSKLVTLKRVGFDIETEGFNPESDELLGFSFSFEDDRGFWMPLEVIKGCSGLLDSLKSFLTDSSVQKILHNGSFDERFLRFKGFPSFKNWRDSMIAASLVDENFPKGLKPLTWRYLTFGGYDEELNEYRRIMKLKTYKGVPDDVMAPYASLDAVSSRRLYNLFEPRLKEDNAIQLYSKILTPVRRVFNEAEYTGFNVDTERAEKLDKLCEKARLKVLDKVYELAGDEFNINSPKQLGQILFSKLRLKPLKESKTGFSCDKESLEFMSKQPKGKIAQSLLDVKYITSQQTRFIQKILKSVWKDGRVHTSYNMAGTVTGRVACSDPGLHSIPRDRFIRSLFIKSDGGKLVETDVKSSELRILTDYCLDPFLLRAFREGRDLHNEVYNLMFKKKKDYIPTDDERFIAKAINFGLIYGRGPKSLARALGCSVKEAAALIELYFERLPRVKEYLEASVLEAKELGYAESLFHRRRHLIDLYSDDYASLARAERQVNNSKVQSASADYTYVGLVRAYRSLKEARIPSCIVHSVHDSSVTDIFKESRAEEAASLIKEAFEAPLSILKVPMKVDVAIVDRWGETKDSRLESILQSVGVLKIVKKETKNIDDDSDVLEKLRAEDEEGSEENYA